MDTIGRMHRVGPIVAFALMAVLGAGAGAGLWLMALRDTAHASGLDPSLLVAAFFGAVLGVMATHRVLRPP